VYFGQYEDPEQAISREKQLKGYARVKTLALIGSTNPGWNDLADEWFPDVHRGDPSLRSG
jgi:putative endonuclease